MGLRGDWRSCLISIGRRSFLREGFDFVESDGFDGFAEGCFVAVMGVYARGIG